MGKRQSNAFMNFGRWLYPCLECNAILPADRDICPICHPGATARLLQEVQPKLFRPVPDAEQQARARAQAMLSNEIYEPAFPADRQKIERVLRERAREHMNWEPGESLDLLIADNIKHGDPVPKDVTNGI